MAYSPKTHTNMVQLTDLSFRPIVENDIDTLNTIEQKAHYHPWSITLLKNAVQTYQCWALLYQQKLIGYGIFKIVLNEAELLNIAITPNMQGKGFGKYLLQQLMQQASKQGALECFLEVRESNYAAYHLYETFGFNEIGRRVNYYPAPEGYEDALIMACLLNK